MNGRDKNGWELGSSEKVVVQDELVKDDFMEEELIVNIWLVLRAQYFLNVRRNDTGLVLRCK